MTPICIVFLFILFFPCFRFLLIQTLSHSKMWNQHLKRLFFPFALSCSRWLVQSCTVQRPKPWPCMHKKESKEVVLMTSFPCFTCIALDTHGQAFVIFSVSSFAQLHQGGTGYFDEHKKLHWEKKEKVKYEREFFRRIVYPLFLYFPFFNLLGFVELSFVWSGLTIQPDPNNFVWFLMGDLLRLSLWSGGLGW